MTPATPLITQGYAVAGVGYRLSDAAQFPAQIHDCKAAIRWLRANAKKYGIDPDRIGVWGPSAGGHLSALLGTSGDVRELEGDLGNAGVSSRVQAVCDFYGPTDFLLSEVGGKADNPDSAVARLLGGPAPQRPEVARSASPAHWISADDPPFLIFQGGKDRTVQPIQSQKFAELLRASKVEAELIEFPDAEHGGPAFRSPETIARIVAFFDRHLKVASRQPGQSK
jgi:acetyl esterase/lipase